MGDKSPETFEVKVNAVVNEMTKSDDGKWQLPEGVDEALGFAAMAERRRRDTQSEYTRSQQELAQLRKQAELLANGWEEEFSATLPANVQADLEELKATDPDAWRTKLNELEQERRSQFKAKKQEIATKAAGETEQEYRVRALEEFQAANPEIVLTDDVIANDIPPRITNKLQKGEITFAQYLNECKDFLAKGKVVAPPGAKAPNTPNLTKTNGSDAPGKQGEQKTVTQQYKEAIF